MENKEMIKPNFDIEIKAEIKGLSKIENNISKVKEIALAMKEWYSTVEFNSEEEIANAVEEKTKINKFKKEVGDYRKNIIAEFKKPIEEFETTAKQTEAILTEVYDGINKPVNDYRDKEKQKTIDQAIEYFNEYQTFKNIDFIKYEDANVNVTLATSVKKVKEDVKLFIDRIATDLELIASDDNNTEILVEYKNNGYNVAQATLVVRNRIKAIQEAKEKELAKQVVVEAQQESVKVVEEVLARPKEIAKTENVEYNEEKIPTTFKVTATLNKLKELKTFLENGGYEYE